jgi:hypothetical protein
MYACPKCGVADNIVINVEVRVRLLQNPDNADAFETERIDGTDEWDENSMACCEHCEYPGRVSDFNCTPTEETESEEDVCDQCFVERSLHAEGRIGFQCTRHMGQEDPSHDEQ